MFCFFSGSYLLAEGKFAVEYSKAFVKSPKFSTNDVSCLKFYFYKIGRNSLKIYLIRNNNVHIPLNEILETTKTWKLKLINIQYSNRIFSEFVSILFEAQHYFGYESVIALDEISFESRSCIYSSNKEN